MIHPEHSDIARLDGALALPLRAREEKGVLESAFARAGRRAPPDQAMNGLIHLLSLGFLMAVEARTWPAGEGEIDARHERFRGVNCRFRFQI